LDFGRAAMRRNQKIEADGEPFDLESLSTIQPFLNNHRRPLEGGEAIQRLNVSTPSYVSKFSPKRERKRRL
jgi:hypothetical protein